MSYIINNYKGTTLAVVDDGSVNTSLDITLIGKNYAGYAELLNENLVFLLENFAGATAPEKPILGQLWYDTISNKLRIYDKNSEWRFSSGLHVSNVAPINNNIGDLWYNTTYQQLFIWGGIAWKLIGPSISEVSDTKIEAAIVKDTNDKDHYILKAKVDTDTVLIISTDETFTLKDSLENDAFTIIHRGVTLSQSSTGISDGDHRFCGTATNSDKLAGKPATSYQLISTVSSIDIINAVNSDVKYTTEKTYTPYVLKQAITDMNHTTQPASTINNKVATTEFVQNAVGGGSADNYENIILSSNSYQLTANEAGRGRLVFEGELYQDCTIYLDKADILPRSWIIYNNTTGNYNVYIKETTQSNRVIIPKNTPYHVAFDGDTVRTIDTGRAESVVANLVTIPLSNDPDVSTAITSTHESYSQLKFTGIVTDNSNVIINNSVTLPRTWNIINSTVKDLIIKKDGQTTPAFVKVPANSNLYILFDGVKVSAINAGVPVTSSEITEGTSSEHRLWSPKDIKEAIDLIRNSAVQPGTVSVFAGSKLPNGYLWCDGTLYAASQYPDLYDAIGTTWGGSLGVSFNVPDFKGYFLRGASNSIALGTTQLDSFKSHVHSIGDHAHTINLEHTHVIDQTAHSHTIHMYDNGYIIENAAILAWCRDMGNLISPGEGVAIKGLNAVPSSETIAISLRNALINNAPTSTNGATQTSAAGEAAETRPINKAVNYIIKY